jgi:hypothetical protein
MAEQTPSEGSASPLTEPNIVGDQDNDESHPRKRQRVRLSCLECRRRKLSCDRGFPCERCLKSGTPERCTYETRPGLAPPAKNGLSQGSLASFDARLSLPAGTSIGDVSHYRKDTSREDNRIRKLELEVAQLKNLLSRRAHSDESVTLNEDSPHKTDLKEAEVIDSFPDCPIGFCQVDPGEGDELRFFRGKEFKTRYFGPHNVFKGFREVSPMLPSSRQTLLTELVAHGPDAFHERDC